LADKVNVDIVICAYVHTHILVEDILDILSVKVLILCFSKYSNL